MQCTDLEGDFEISGNSLVQSIQKATQTKESWQRRLLWSWNFHGNPLKLDFIFSPPQTFVLSHWFISHVLLGGEFLEKSGRKQGNFMDVFLNMETLS